MQCKSACLQSSPHSMLLSDILKGLLSKNCEHYVIYHLVNYHPFIKMTNRVCLSKKLCYLATKLSYIATIYFVN